MWGCPLIYVYQPTNYKFVRHDSRSLSQSGLLTHWSRVTHICVSKLTIIGSDNGLSLGRRQGIIWTNAGILLFEPLWTNFREILIETYTFSLKKMGMKMSSAKWRPFCLGLNVWTGMQSTGQWVPGMPRLEFSSQQTRTTCLSSLCQLTINIIQQIWWNILYSAHWYIYVLHTLLWSCKPSMMTLIWLGHITNKRVICNRACMSPWLPVLELVNRWPLISSRARSQIKHNDFKIYDRLSR